jgi:hypothetical protein
MSPSVHEKFAGMKWSRQVGGNSLAFGEKTFSTTLRNHPRSELPRAYPARSWRAPYCTLWRDGCERCVWAPADGTVDCFRMADPKTCTRIEVVCEEVDADLITNHCIWWDSGCNTCGLEQFHDGSLNTPCEAALCGWRAYYDRGFTCEQTWQECLRNPSAKSPRGYACDRNAGVIRKFRALKREQIRARLRAFER